MTARAMECLGVFIFLLGFEAPGFPGTGAGNGNRTRLASLEGWRITTMLCPHFYRICTLETIISRPFLEKPQDLLKACRVHIVQPSKNFEKMNDMDSGDSIM